MGHELERVDSGFRGVLRAMFMTSADKVNTINRCVAEYKPSDVDVFFDASHGVHNALISGGDQRLRSSAIVAQTLCAMSNDLPVIIIHEGNHFIERQLRNDLSGIGLYNEISTNCPCFEPFYGLNDLEISNQILDTAPKEFDIKYNVRYYIEGIITYLDKLGKKPSFLRLSSCPHSTMFDRIDDLEIRGVISDFEAQELKSKLMMGQSENYKLDSFLASLQHEMRPLMYASKKGSRPINVISVLRKGGVLCFDLTSITNKILLNTVIYQLRLALTKGMRYMIVIDSIPLDSDQSYAAYIRSQSDKVVMTIASEDFYAMAGGDDNVFSAVVGNMQTMIVMNHSSGRSATKWSEVFGQYDKLEESYSNSYGRSRRNSFSIFSSPNHNKTVSISKSREYIVRPEAITRMVNGEAFVRTATLGQICHLYLN